MASHYRKEMSSCKSWLVYERRWKERVEKTGWQGPVLPDPRRRRRLGCRYSQPFLVGSQKAKERGSASGQRSGLPPSFLNSPFQGTPK